MREDVLVELKPTVAEAALRIGVSRVTLSRVINGHAGIDPNLAVRLERAGAGDGSRMARHADELRPRPRAQEQYPRGEAARRCLTRKRSHASSAVAARCFRALRDAAFSVVFFEKA